MLRIVVLALLLVLGGTSFTSSPAHAQVSIPGPAGRCFTLFPLTKYEGEYWFELLQPSCPPRQKPRCFKKSACTTQFGEASVCREWRCVLAGLPPVKRDPGECVPPGRYGECPIPKKPAPKPTCWFPPCP
jgi:hypothetical protein